MAIRTPKWIKYPKLLALALTFIFAYLALSSAHFELLREYVVSFGYAGTFIAGVMYVFGFTAAPATAILLLLSKTQNIFIAAGIAGFGALLGDLVIYRIIKYSFANELDTFSKEWAVTKIIFLIPDRIFIYALPILGALIIASPLPDEIGIALLATSKKV